jgi:hypothetical protein
VPRAVQPEHRPAVANRADRKSLAGLLRDQIRHLRIRTAVGIAK